MAKPPVAIPVLPHIDVGPCGIGSSTTSSQPACGGKPKIFAIGIAPPEHHLNCIVPMGVDSIGVVPMGVLSIGAVAMGLINASVVGMGILIGRVNVMDVWWGGMDGIKSAVDNGGQVHHHDRSGRKLYAYLSREIAQKKAKKLSCVGVHAMGSL